MLVVVLSLALVVTPSARALTGGEPDSDERHPEVLTLRATSPVDQAALCSAVKIGPDTLLTAAHCIVDAQSGALRPAFRPGAVVGLDNAALQESRAGALKVSIEKVHLPPAYRDGLAKFADYRRRRLAELTAGSSTLPSATLEQGLRLRHHFAARYPDVALLRLQAATPSIPIKAVAFGPVQPGDKVELVGFGCATPGTPARSNLPLVRRSGWSRVIRVDEVNLYTHAGQRIPSAPSLCPGDSGGSVLRKGRVIGIHTVVYGLNARHGARSNMAVRLQPLADWSAWPNGLGDRGSTSRPRLEP